ncbi:MAG: GNAT family N-acetyltransferase [Bacteroidota bacterium]
MSEVRATWHGLDDASARAAYASLLAASPQRTPFHTLVHADAACRAFGLTGEILAVGLPGEAPRVAGVVFWKQRGPFRLAVVPPLTPYGGPVCAETLDDTLSGANPLGTPKGALMRWIEALRDRADFVELHLPPAFADARPFAWAGWNVTPRFTYAGASDWGGTVPPYVRKMVRENRATRTDGSPRPNGLVLQRDDSATALVADFVTRPFRRQGREFGFAEDALEQLVRAHVAGGLGRILVAAKRDGTPVGAVATTVDDLAGYFWAGSAEPGAGMLMLMAATADALADDGIPTIDLVGGNLQTVSSFKRRLGFPLVASARVEVAPSRALRLVRALR